MNIMNKHNNKTSSLRHNISLFLITASIVFTFLSTSSEPIVGSAANQCMFRDYTENDLSITDIVLESAKKDTTCLKAKFRLRIKVETQPQSQGNQSNVPVIDRGDFWGYIPLDSVIDVENTCPDNIATIEARQANRESAQPTDMPIDELRMAVQFLCGNLTFTFRKISNLTLLTLAGSINLDDKSNRSPFESEDPVVFVWDPSKHFKLNNLLEIKSHRQFNDLSLTANFFNLEVEPFRNTMNRDFIRPPDEKSTASNLREFKERESV